MESDESEAGAGNGANTNDDLFYQELGSATLLYQNQASTEEDEALYSPPWAAVGYKSQQGQIPADLRTKLIHSSVQRTRRSQARWYYPLDFHHFNTEGEDEPDPERRKTKRIRESDAPHDNDYPFSVRPNLVRQARELNALDPLRSEEFLNTRILPSVEESRKAMMSSQPEDDNPHCIWSDSHTATNDCASKNRKQVLKQHKKYDDSYIPAQWKLFQNKTLLDAPKIHLNEHRCDSSLYFAQQRRLLADPRYLAPFPMDSLHTVLEADMLAKERNLLEKSEEVEDYDPRDTQQRNQDIPPNILSHKDTDHPLEYGNCLLCMPCSCPACVDDGHPNWCLLHPMGATLDKLAASLVTTPRGTQCEPLLNTRRNSMLLRKSNRAWSTYNELRLGDGIRQIEQCSSAVVLVRTSIHVSLIAVTACEDDTKSLFEERHRKGSSTRKNKRLCWGTFELTELQRIDLRSISRHKISYFPIDVASNRKFAGSKFINHQYKFAILSHTKHGKDRNIVHHFLWSTEGKAQGKNLYTKHRIRNLKSISQICFSAKHPMILWAAAEAYARPNLAPDRAIRQNDLNPRFGSGHSLYTIDLRNNLGTFQWSPSSEEFLVEGTHSIDGISAGLGSSETSTLWVSSISAGKMWELDANLLPARALICWTLPYQVESLGPCLPVSGGLYGSGRVLMSSIIQSKKEDSVFQKSKAGVPVLSVGVGSESSGIHLYPGSSSAASMFQTDPLECSATPALSSWKGHRLATFSVFGTGNFVGIAPICLSPACFLPSQQDEFANSSAIFTFLMTACGDIYSHKLLVSAKELSPKELSLWSSHAVPEVVKVEKKLVGGINIGLGVHGRLPLPRKGLSRNMKKIDNVDVRPFKTLDLRSMQTGEISAEDHPGDAAHVVKAINTNSDYLVWNENGMLVPNKPQQWLIPSHVKSAERENLVYLCPSWLNSSKISDIDELSNEEVERSDVNSQVLKLLQGSKLDS